ncbi:PspC domain-containing protein [Marinomonas agarivorans]|nr:PspC domain-containing protein [Marinomonas agarivorans]
MKHKMRFKENKQSGWGMNLYRNREEGYLGGVCAGLAEHFDIDTWVVRLTVFTAFLFLGGFVLLAYIVLWVMLKPNSGEVRYEYDEKKHRYAPKKMFKYSDSANTRLRRARVRIQQASSRIEALERHVTSKRFDLEQEFSAIKDK